MTTFISFFEIPQKFFYETGFSAMSTDFSGFSPELGKTRAPLKTCFWFIGKLKYRTNLWATFCVSIHLKKEIIELKRLQKLLLVALYLPSSIGTTPYTVVNGLKPDIRISLKLGHMRHDYDLCQHEICLSLPKHSHVSVLANTIWIPRKFRWLNKETKIKTIYRKVSQKFAKRIIVL